MIYFQGDLVIGNSEASEHYGITRTGSRWKVINRQLGEGRTIPPTEEDRMIDLCAPKDFDAALREIEEDGYVRYHDVYTVMKKCFDLVEAAPNGNKVRAGVLEKFDD